MEAQKIALSTEENEARIKKILEKAKDRTCKIDLIINARNSLLNNSKNETEVNIINLGADLLINML